MAERLRRLGAFLVTSLLVLTSVVTPAMAQNGPPGSGGPRISLLRDAEIETDIRTMVDPIWKAAGLDPTGVRIVLVNDDTLNAFVAGGQNIFIHSGLLTSVKTPEQLMGVIAHETGHIAGGHLTRFQDALRNATLQQVIGMVLGAVAIVAGGGEAGTAVMAGSSQLAERSLLKYSRTQESSADQAAVTFLDKIHVTARGLSEFLEIIENDQALLRSNRNPYVYTHPLTPERVAALETRVSQSPYQDRAADPAYVVMLDRIQGKIHGFLDNPERTIRTVDLNTIGGRYARAIALYRKPDMPAFLTAIDKLLVEVPNDPYFLELKGQALFENGRAAEAVPAYQAAVAAAPKEPLLRVGLAGAMIGTEDARLLDPAIREIEQANAADSENAMAWYQLAIAYGRKENIGMAALASAERFLLIGQFEDAYQQAQRAQQKLPAGSPGALRAADILDLSLRMYRGDER